MFEVTFAAPADDPFFGIVRRDRAMLMLKDVGVDPLSEFAPEPECAWEHVRRGLVGRRLGVGKIVRLERAITMQPLRVWILLGMCFLSWDVRGQKKATEVVIPIDGQPTNCSFEVFEAGQELTADSKALMYGTGLGISKQKEGSLVRLESHSRPGYTEAAFPGWINTEGNLVSALYGFSFSKLYPSGITRLSYSDGDSKRFRLLEKTNSGWKEFSDFKDIQVSLPSGSEASKAVYSLLSNVSPTEYSVRLLKYLGIGMPGSQVKVRLDLEKNGKRYEGTGSVDAKGKLEITDYSTWNPNKERE